MKMKIELLQGDCLELMKNIPSGSVDCILADVPYGTTACKWDSVIPFEPMWEQLNRIIKPNGAICLFGSEPFSSALRMSNIKNFKYDWIWEKEQGANFMLCKYQPYKVHEIVSVFSKAKHNYFPHMTEGKPYISGKGTSGEITGNRPKVQTKNEGKRYPRSIQRFNTEKTSQLTRHKNRLPCLNTLSRHIQMREKPCLILQWVAVQQVLLVSTQIDVLSALNLTMAILK